MKLYKNNRELLIFKTCKGKLNRCIGYNYAMEGIRTDITCGSFLRFTIVVFFSIFNMLYNFNGKRRVSNQEHKVTELCKKNIKMEIPCLLAEKHFVTT